MPSRQQDPETPARLQGKGRPKKSNGINFTEFARRDGCSPSRVSQAVMRGELRCIRGTDLLDPGLVGTGWRSMNRKKLEANGGGKVPELKTPKGVLSRQESEMLQAHYATLKRKMELDLALGSVYPADVVNKRWMEIAAKIRSKILAFPSERSADLALLLGSPLKAAEVQDYLLEHLTTCLRELSSGGFG